MASHATIVGTGSSVPKRILSNKQLEHLVDTSDEWITRRTGIRERRISAPDGTETSSELAAKASVRALEMAGVTPEDLDMIAVGTVTPDRQFPSAACMVQEALNADNAASFDVSAGCSGFLYALSMVDNAIRTGSCRTALVAGVERLSTILDWQDRSTCVLLGDGAGAVVVSATSNGDGILSTHLKSNGKLWSLLYSTYRDSNPPEIVKGIDAKPFILKMEGNRLFKKAVGCLTDISREALDRNGLTTKDIRLVVPHQANIRIIQAVADNLGIPMESVFTNVDRYGNTSSASIPIALDEANRKGLIQKGDNLLLVSFGAGLTWGAAILRWSMGK